MSSFYIEAAAEKYQRQARTARALAGDFSKRDEFEDELIGHALQVEDLDQRLLNARRRFIAKAELLWALDPKLKSKFPTADKFIRYLRREALLFGNLR